MVKKYVYLQVFERDIFDPQFYRTMEEAQDAMFFDFEEQLMNYGFYDEVVAKYGSRITSIPKDWFNDGNVITSDPADIPQYELGRDYFWMCCGDDNYDAKIINMDEEE